MAETFRNCIEEERSTGRTVLLSSHILAEVEALCDHVTIIRAGRVVESGALSDLRHLTRTSVTAELDAEPVGLAELRGVHDLRIEGTTVRCHVDPGDLGEALRRLAAAGSAPS